MNQLEFENYIEKMRNRNKEGDFKTAAKIADKIDWEKVEDISLLVFASTIYENIKDFDSARALLEYAYSIAPVKNRLYFPLCIINIKAGDLERARNYYIDFCQNFPEDNRKNLLKYYFLKARGADIDQRIRVLKEYTDEEKEEDLLYELALLYDKIGDRENVIKICDFIVSFFGIKVRGLGKDALILKKKYQELNEEEKNLLSDYNYAKNHMEEVDSNFNFGEDDRVFVMKKEDKIEEYQVLEEDKKRKAPIEHISRKENIEEEKDENDLNEDKINKEYHINFSPDKDSYNENELENNAFLNNEDEKEKLKKMIEEIKKQNGTKNYSFMEFRQRCFNLKRRFKDMKIEDIKLHMIIEAYTKEEGIEIAKSELNYIHNALNEKVGVAKASAYNINEKGLGHYLQKLGSRDLIIENAGRLSNATIDELEEFILNKNHKNIIVLVDIVNNFDRLANERYTFIERFDIYSVLSEKNQEILEGNDKDIKVKEIAKDDALNKVKNDAKKIKRFETEDENLRVVEEQEKKTYLKTRETDDTIEVRSNDDLIDKALSIKRKNNKKDDGIKEMTVDEFVEFCKSYAKSIDCVMLGKTIPALYERVEDMKEDGERLTEENAIQFMEETADNADKRGLFHKPKYDKEDRLIIEEHHFA